MKNPGHMPGLLPRKKPVGAVALKPPLAIPPRSKLGGILAFSREECYFWGQLATGETRLASFSAA